MYGGICSGGDLCNSTHTLAGGDAQYHARVGGNVRQYPPACLELPFYILVFLTFLSPCYELGDSSMQYCLPCQQNAISCFSLFVDSCKKNHLPCCLPSVRDFK